MSDGTVYRAAADLEVKGRTLEGLALPWETWQTVRDLRGPAYPEAHARTSLDVTLRSDPGPRPLFSWHDYATSDPAADPIGVAHFVRSESALMFRAFLSRTRKADEQLELVKDGAKRSVSVALDLLQHRNVPRPGGLTGKLRTESRLRELSIAPTGFGQFPQARVLAIRASAPADATFADISEAVSDAIGVRLFGKDGAPDGVYVYLQAIGDGWAVYAVEGGALDHPELNDNWRVDYVIGADDSVTISEPVRVEQTWVPADNEPATRSVHGLAVPPARDQLLRMRAGRPLLRSNIDPPA